MNSDGHERKTSILVICIVSIVFAAGWPLIYPALDYVMALLNFSSSPSFFKAITEFGPIYGKLSPTASGFFKGMAESSEHLGGEHPALASLPYMTKAGLLMYVSMPIYVIEFIVFAAVGFLSFSSRLLPWQKARTAVQASAIIASVFPLIAICVWWIIFIVIAYVQAWSASLLDLVFLIFLFPAVCLRVVSPSIGIFVLARFFVPSGLVFAGEGSIATKAYDSLVPDY